MAPAPITRPADKPVTVPCCAANSSTPTDAPPAVPTPAPTPAAAVALAFSFADWVISSFLKRTCQSQYNPARPRAAEAATAERARGAVELLATRFLRWENVWFAHCLPHFRGHLPGSRHRPAARLSR